MAKKKASHFSQKQRIKQMRDFLAYREAFKKRLRNAQGNAVMAAVSHGAATAGRLSRKRRRKGHDQPRNRKGQFIRRRR